MMLIEIIILKKLDFLQWTLKKRGNKLKNITLAAGMSTKILFCLKIEKQKLWREGGLSSKKGEKYIIVP